MDFRRNKRFRKKIRSKKTESVIVWQDELTNDQIFLRMVCWFLRDYEGSVKVVNVKNWYDWENSNRTKILTEYKASNLSCDLDFQERSRYSDEYVRSETEKKCCVNSKKERLFFYPSITMIRIFCFW